jgi:hypothetical protein
MQAKKIFHDLDSDLRGSISKHIGTIQQPMKPLTTLQEDKLETFLGLLAGDWFLLIHKQLMNPFFLFIPNSFEDAGFLVCLSSACSTDARHTGYLQLEGFHHFVAPCFIIFQYNHWLFSTLPSARNHVQFLRPINGIHTRDVDPVCKHCMSMFPTHQHPFLHILRSITKFGSRNREESFLENPSIKSLFKFQSWSCLESKALQ